MPTLKSLAAQRGLVLGVGPVDPSVPTYPAVWVDPPAPGGYGGPPNGYSWSFPTELDAATNQPASIIVNDFGGALDLCAWAKGPGDLSHYGKFGRWHGPITVPASESYRPGEYDFRGIDETYAWAEANGMRCWMSDPAYSGIPDWVATWVTDPYEGDSYSFNYTPAQATTLLHDWYTAVYSRYPNLYATTILNELSRGHLTKPNTVGWYQNTSIGEPGGYTLLEWCATILGWIRAANPNVKIVVNEYGAEFDLAFAAQLRDWVLGLKALFPDIGGVGIQSHIFSKKTQAQWNTYKQVLQLFAAAGLEPHVTEFDCNRTGTEQDLYNDYYWGVRAAIESGVVETFNFWTIKDPLFYGTLGGGGTPLPGLGAPYTPTSGVLYGDVTHLTPTISRQAIEDALEPPPGPHTLRAEAGASEALATLVPGADLRTFSARGSFTAPPLSASVTLALAGAGSFSAPSPSAALVLPTAVGAGAFIAPEFLSPDTGHRIRAVAGASQAVALLVPGADAPSLAASGGFGAVALSAELPLAFAGAGAFVAPALTLGLPPFAGAGAFVPPTFAGVLAAPTLAARGTFRAPPITDGTSLPPPATLHNPVLGTLPHPWWRRHGRAW